MRNKYNYRALLEPMVLKHVTLKNRIVKAPYSSTNADENGYVIDSAVQHYDALARGGIGLFINESVAIEPLGVTGSPRMAIWNDSYIAGQKILVDTVHRHGVPILTQLHHAGPAHSTGIYGGSADTGAAPATPRAASTLTTDQLPGARPNLPLGLTVEEIGALTDKYVRAAERAQEAGFDGVELHFANSYLMNSFFSRAWNKRTDAYGGSVENRARFAVEVTRSVRQAVGNAFIIGARMNSAEHGARFGNGLTYDETSQIAKMLEGAGVDLLHMFEIGYNDMAWIGFPEQSLYPEPPTGMNRRKVQTVLHAEANVAGVARIRESISIPIIVNGGMTFESADRAVRNGDADLVSFARPLIADPDAPNKLHAGAAAEIRPCTRCMTCFDGFMRSEHERCRVNAAFAKEGEMTIVPAATAKRVLVIGGGPAGMEAARVASLRGHSVMLYEQRKYLGGLMPLAALIKDRHVDDIGTFINYLKRQIRRLNVTVKLGTTVDADLVRKLAPDAIIVAAGARLETIDIPGIDSRHVLTSAQLMRQTDLPLRFLPPRLLEWGTRKYLPVGRRVVLIGGLLQGVELAEFLVHRGRHVVVTDTSPELGTGILEFHRQRALNWLSQKGSELLSGVTYEAVERHGLRLVTKEGERRLIEGDTIIALPVRREDSNLRQQLGALVPDVHFVGDCNNPGMIVDAVESGYRAACAI